MPSRPLASILCLAAIGLLSQAAPALADCQSDVARRNALMHKILERVDVTCADPGYGVRVQVPLREEFLRLDAAIKSCPLLPSKGELSGIERGLAFWRNFEKHCADQRRQRQESLRPDESTLTRKTSSIFDCSRKPMAGGASWDAECLETRRARSFEPVIAPAQVDRKAGEQCQGVAAEVRQHCMTRQRIQILMTEEPSIRRMCATSPDDDLANCVGQAYAAALKLDQLRQELSDTLARETAAQEQAAPEVVLSPSQTVTAPPQREERAQVSDKDDIYCSFVTYHIRNGDPAYGRWEQVPAQCRGMPDVKVAFDAYRKAYPTAEDMRMVQSETQEEIRAYLSSITDRKGSNLLEQVAPR